MQDMRVFLERFYETALPGPLNGDARMSIVLSAGTNLIHLDITDGLDTYDSKIQGIFKMAGFSNFADGVAFAADNAFSSKTASNKATHRSIIAFSLDGTDNFCQNTALVDRIGVDFKLFAVGVSDTFERSTLQCVIDKEETGNQVYRIDTYKSIPILMEDFANLVCPTDVSTPFDKTYHLTGTITHDHIVWTNTDRVQIYWNPYWNERWVITGFGRGSMVSSEGVHSVPADRKLWTYYGQEDYWLNDPQSQLYVRITCSATDVPTILPTMLPTTSPEPVPTQAPRTSPTHNPTTSPTSSPFSPTTKPTTEPTTTSPTTAPTPSPSTSPTRDASVK